ncbi:Gfo/Idh/MocA family oxidoreductase [Ruminococcaceae bacterium OttesenSCG-928-D13]|nr:Gfo/Idh/MocA family oxidoreductase [Ruminococcaceae bacterium OttesenSCG-928-D13]
MDKLRVGLIGCGDVAEKKQMEAMRFHSDRCLMVGFADVNLARAEAMKAKYGAENAVAVSDYRKMLEDKNIDVVHVQTPNAFHANATNDALEAGKHVMCEKPMAHNIEAAKSMVETAKRTGKKLSISYQYRFREDSQLLKHVCERGELGEIYYAKAQAIGRKRVPTWGQFLNQKAQGGGPLIDLGTHALDLTMWFMDNYDVDYVMGSSYHKLKDYPQGNLHGHWESEKFEVEDSAFGFIRMKNGATIALESSWALNILDVCPASATLCGTKGGAEQRKGDDLHPFSWAINTVKNDRMYTVSPDHPSHYGNEFASPNELFVEAPRRELATWFDAITNNTAPVVLPEQALTVSLVLDAIYRSSESGQPVYFSGNGTQESAANEG